MLPVSKVWLWNAMPTNMSPSVSFMYSMATYPRGHHPHPRPVNSSTRGRVTGIIGHTFMVPDPERMGSALGCPVLFSRVSVKGYSPVSATGPSGKVTVALLPRACTGVSRCTLPVALWLPTV